MTAYRDVVAVMNSRLRFSPPKQTFDNRLTDDNLAQQRPIRLVALHAIRRRGPHPAVLVQPQAVVIAAVGENLPARQSTVIINIESANMARSVGYMGPPAIDGHTVLIHREKMPDRSV